MNLYHYCSNAAFLSIISNREIWASEFSLSNDLLEGRWLHEIFSKYCDEKGVTGQRKLELLEHLDVLNQISGAAGFCMSEEGDLLSQWRGYADNAAGVSVGFSKEYFEELGNLKRDRGDEFNASLTRVEYDLTKQKNIISEHADRIIELTSDGAFRRGTLAWPMSDTEEQAQREKFGSMILRFMMFFFHLYAFKNPAFAEEREWRLISHLIRSSKDDEVDKLVKMEFRPLIDRIIPFNKISLEALAQPSITEIILGPKNVTPENLIRAALRKYGWISVEVRRSTASYR
jgi:DUF2971 family protein